MGIRCTGQPYVSPSWSTIPAIEFTPSYLSHNLRQYLTESQGSWLSTLSIIGNLPLGVELVGDNLVYDGVGATSSSSVQVRAIDWYGGQGDSLSFDISVNNSASDPAERAFITKFDDPNLWVNGVDIYAGLRNLRGTDQTTGLVFSSTSPQIWGAQNFEPGVQRIVMDGHNMTPDELFPTSIYYDQYGRSSLRTRRTADYIAVDQANYRIQTATNWRDQTMVYIRMYLRVENPGPITGSCSWALMAMKTDSASGDSRLSLRLNRQDPFGWMLSFGAVRDDATNMGVWGVDGTPTVTCTPTQNSFWGGYFYHLGCIEPVPPGSQNYPAPPPQWDTWWTIEYAFRLEDSIGQVQGNDGKLPFFWCATTQGTAAAPAPNGTGTQRGFVQARNMHSQFHETYPSGAGNFFFSPWYTDDNEFTGKARDIGSLEVWTGWPPDASEHPDI